MSFTMDYKSTWESNPMQILEVAIDDLIIMPELSGRSGDFKRDDKKVKELAESIKLRGQIEPAICGINTDEALGPLGAPVLYMGFGRAEACKQAGVGLLSMYSADPVSSVLVTSMHENTKRENLSPVQIAENIKRLRAAGYKDSAIASEMGWSKSQVSIYGRLLLTEADDVTPLYSKYALTQIHEEKIPARAAYQLADLGSSAKIDKAIHKALEKAKATGKKVKSADVIDDVREELEGDGEGGTAKKNGKKVTKARSMKQLLEHMESYNVAGVPEPVRKTVQLFLGFAAGTKNEKDLEKVLMKL